MLEDKEAAPFEFAVRANDEELKELQEMFDELSSAEEASMLHFSGWLSATDAQANSAYDTQIRNIYRLLHRLGTDETKRGIEAAGILE